MANKAAIALLSENPRSRFDLPVGVRAREIGEPFKTGVAEVDEVLQGGFPRATLTELSGSPSSNRTALTIAALARACHAGECCAWIDAAGAFDPGSAADAGLPLERLLWINCRGNAEYALKATDLLLQGGGFGLMVFDLLDIAERDVRRISMTSWFRLRHAAEEMGTALIALTPFPHTGSCSGLSVALTRRKSLWRGKLLRGISARLQRRRHFQSHDTGFASVL